MSIRTTLTKPMTCHHLQSEIIAVISYTWFGHCSIITTFVVTKMAIEVDDRATVFGNNHQ